MATSIYGGIKLHVLMYIVLSQTMAHTRFFIVSLDNGVLRFNPLFCSDVLSEIGNNFIFFFIVQVKTCALVNLSLAHVNAFYNTSYFQ